MHRDAYSILKELLRVTSPFLGEDFLNQAVQAMYRLFGADFAFISRVLDVPPTRVRVLAAWADGAPKEGWEFDLEGTPCDVVYDHSKSPDAEVVVQEGHVLIPQNLWSRFPATRDTTYQAFLGLPLFNRDREMIGHVAVFFKDPLHDAAQLQLTLEIVQLLAHRIEAEMYRMVLEAETKKANEELEKANARLLKESMTDPLTEVSNRRYFQMRCKEAFARFRRSGEQFALLLLDVDLFKSINDRYGHDVGDQVLKAVAEVLSRNLRASIEVVARIGGEEFAVVCHGVHHAPEALVLAERLRMTINARPLDVGDRSIRVSTSVGVALCSAEDETWESVYRRADGALYAAKGKGRNQVSLAEATPG